MGVKTLTALLCVTAALVAGTAAAQPVERGARAGAGGSAITGRVIDGVGKAPLEYANVILFDAADSAQVDGTITAKDGAFRLAPVRPGVYDLEIKFMGFQAKRIEDIRLKPQEQADVGVVSLDRAVISLEAVEVSAEKPDLVFKIDKKVINVDKQIAARGGTAVDVLENVPSVTVDIEGNVSLRGSSSFTVLVDDKPTVLEPSEVLQQIPASTIENIEIITNPSAKFDPDGVSGIVNVITKKGQPGGTSGIVNLNGGLNYTYGGDFLLSRKGGKVNTYLGLNYNRRESPGSSRSLSKTMSDTLESIIESSGDSRWKRIMYSGKAGLEINPSLSDFLSFEGEGASRTWGRNSNENFDEWTTPGDDHDIHRSHNESERGSDSFQGSAYYRHGFDTDGHQLTARAVFTHEKGDEESETELRDRLGATTSGRRSTEDGPENQVRLKADYTLPFDKERKFEAGYDGRFDRSRTDSKFCEFVPDSAGYVFRPEYSHTTEYERDIHALYALYAGGWGKLGYQAGIRTEYVDRLVRLEGEGESYSTDRWDFFPTLHLSYRYSEGNQLMASYTRRIDRPRSWYLEPFLTWSDAYNVRQGNPSLKPEYIDSYEMGYQKDFGANMVSVETYYRVTHNRTERVESVYQDNVLLHSVDNVGKDYTFGSDVMVNLTPVKLWNLSLMGNLYDYRVKGVLYDEPFSEESFTWRIRANNTFKVTGSMRIQVTSFYNSRRVSAQGDRKGFYSTNLGVRQDFMKRTLSLSLQVRDVFRNGRYRFTSEGPGFYNRNEFRRRSPSVWLTLTYNFNNYKPEREVPEEGERFEGIDEF
jgi:outer membrane receptor protein involved in Fe transport